MPNPVRKMNFECRICKQSADCEVFQAREMMFGSREAFDYVLCSACACLQIERIPDDLGRHYPSNYYSQLPRQEPPSPRGLKGAVMRWYCRSAALQPRSRLASLLRARLPVPSDFAEFGNYLVEAELQNAGERILDVGCGASPYRLAAFRRCGFAGVEGIDPFLPSDTEYMGIPVYRRTVSQMDGVYGLVMFHHSLEHVPDPLEALRDAARLLRPGGCCLVRIPVMGTYFWNTFGVDWAELDAPRHLYLMARTTVDFLAQAAGFRLRSSMFDSQGWELAASYQYQADIPLRDPRSFSEGGAQRFFESGQMQALEAQAARLNRAGDGGRACFFLEKL